MARIACLISLWLLFLLPVPAAAGVSPACSVPQGQSENYFGAGVCKGIPDYFAWWRPTFRPEYPNASVQSYTANGSLMVITYCSGLGGCGLSTAAQLFCLAGATLNVNGVNSTCTTPPTKCEGLQGVPYPGYRLTFAGRPPTGGSRAACFDGCRVEPTGTDVCWGLDGGSWVCNVAQSVFSGQVCTTEPSLTPGATPTSVSGVTTTGTLQEIPEGMCPGEVNGSQVFMPCGSVSTGTTTSATTVVGSSTVTTNGQSSTVCANGMCTTTFSKTTTVSAPSASSTASIAATTGTAVQSQDAYCKQNPTDKVCTATSSSFAGSCQAGAFVCNGDAVSCATARAVNESKCLLAGTTDMSSVVNALTAGTYGTATSVNRAFSTSFDQTNPYSSSCPSDLSFSLMGMSSSIPLSNYCTQLQMMGNALVAFTLLAAALFVFRGSN